MDQTSPQRQQQIRAYWHAEDLAHCTAELLRFGREGPALPRYPFGLEDITMSLAKALAFVLRHELETLAAQDDPADEAELEQGGQLRAALQRWLLDQDFEARG
jgi:hypothetical protein